MKDVPDRAIVSLDDWRFDIYRVPESGPASCGLDIPGAVLMGMPPATMMRLAFLALKTALAGHAGETIDRVHLCPEDMALFTAMLAAAAASLTAGPLKEHGRDSDQMN